MPNEPTHRPAAGGIPRQSAAMNGPRMVAQNGPAAGNRRDWRFWLAAGLVLLGALLNTLYLFHHCPIDLSEDEAHYWEWSRHLDYGYYSKPPGIAWVIWATLRLGGMLGLNGDGSGSALAPVMRMAAVIFGFFSGIISLLLARRMFRDDGKNGNRTALAVILLSAAVPMFAVGSLLITIDSPMYLCWAATVYCLWRAVESGSQWSVASGRKSTFWLYAAGVAAAAGMMFKPVGIALPICCAIGAWADGARGPMRRALKSRHAAGALAVMLASQIPVVIWNANHNWVTFRHIFTQGFGSQAVSGKPHSALQSILLDPLSRLAEFLGGQAGGMAGIMFVLLVIAVVVAWQRARGAAAPAQLGDAASPTPPDAPGGLSRTRWIFLLSFTVPLWGFYLLMNLWKHTEVNWPAASYFTGMILLAGVWMEGWNAADEKIRRAWKTWGTIAVAWGVLLTAAVLNAHRLYPLATARLEPLKGTPKYFSSWWHPNFWEKPIADKLLGKEARGDLIENLRSQLARETGQDPLIITGRYDTSSSLSFYLPGHPFVYCLMHNLGGRMSQYDLWPGLNQTQDNKPVFAGRPALIVGIDGKDFDDVVRPAFARVEGPRQWPVVQDGVILKMLTVYRAWGFKGSIGSAAGGAY